MIKKITNLPNDFLVNLATNGQRHIWIGSSSPFPMRSTEIRKSTNFRLSSILHGAFDVVWYYHPDLSALSPKQWKIVLDEIIRLIDGRGSLVLRYSQNNHFSVIGLKNFLARRIGLSVSVLYENFTDGFFTTVFSVARDSMDAYRSKVWSFGILTQGERVDNVVRFLESVRQEKSGHEHEIIIVGPKDDRYASYNVVYNDKEYSTVFADITVKKNDIAKLAHHPNLMIVHDRYKLDKGFFEGFEHYGYDFDFLTIKQWYETGKEFPSYCALTERDFVWSTPVQMNDYQLLEDSQYVNGGLIIIKTHLLRMLPFNELMFWNQAEDVELSRVMAQNSIPLRMNFLCSATVVGVPESYTKMFKIMHSAAATRQLFYLRHSCRTFVLSLYTKLSPSFRKMIRQQIQKSEGLRRVKAMLLG